MDEIGIHRAKGTRIQNKEQTADYSSTKISNNIPPPPVSAHSDTHMCDSMSQSVCFSKEIVTEIFFGFF